MGLVQKISEPDKLIDDCLELCEIINRNGKLIAGHTKEYIYRFMHEHQGWEEGNKLHGEFYAHLRQSKNYDEGTAAFVEKRRPDFSDAYYSDTDRLPGIPKPPQP